MQTKRHIRNIPPNPVVQIYNDYKIDRRTGNINMESLSIVNILERKRASVARA